ncbi:hypothetical protein [Sinomonas mesophila]|uniref:hypothetical protein n=1 Tax=Sinomonas mesophila TaxID=1531955 RepID=UPI0009862AB6
MENLLPPLAILLVVAAAVLVIRAGVRRSRASLGDALSDGPEAAAAAAARLTEAQHRSIYSLIARGQTVQAIAAYREATHVRLVEARNAVLLLDRYPQPYRGGQAAPAAPPTSAEPGRPGKPVSEKPAPGRPAGEEPAPTGSAPQEPTRPQTGGTEPAPMEPTQTAGPDARSHRDAADAPVAGRAPEVPRTPEQPPAVVRPENGPENAVHPTKATEPPAKATADSGEGRPQRFPYRYRAIVSNGRQTLEVASNMLNDQIYSEIKELAHIGDTEDAAQMLCRHSDISIEDARAFVALL